MSDCQTCAGLRLAAAELIQTIENLLEANKDYTDKGRTFLPPLYLKALATRLKKVRADLEGLEGLASAPIPPPRTPEQQARAAELARELASLPPDIAEVIHRAAIRAGERFLAEKVSRARNLLGKISQENVKKLLAGPGRGLA